MPSVNAPRNLEVCYGKLRALNAINLQVHEGEIVALLGANGAGKTTALRAISGLRTHCCRKQRRRYP
ncbi:ATP-binding cassette domain-containing protein [Bradyrhizobium sp. CNPSo 4026]|nr:ATP-binding cassette domain-containing protein [Bradyrhizobium cenepequi]